MNLQDARELIEIARESILSHLEKRSFRLKQELRDKFSSPAAVFVTLKKNGELRGCIGFTEAKQELWIAIMRAARASAFEDPRFMPLSEEEFKEIEIEISILTPPKRIHVSDPEEYFDHIDIGYDGLIVRKGHKSGLLLPQVAIEHNMDSREFLQHTCLKAGLPADSYRDDDCFVYKFQANVYAEENGKVVKKV